MLKICPKCGYSMMFYAEFFGNKTVPHWKCTNCGHVILKRGDAKEESDKDER